jgi:hypothetical protein
MKVSKTIDYQLGWYVGEYIFMRMLPTLSTDLLKSRKVIQVTIAEADEYHRLEELWRQSYKDNHITDEPNEHWINATKFRHELAKKYLPNPLECFIPIIECLDTTDIQAFKAGIRDVLWDTDLCWYNIEKDEDIEIMPTSERWHTQINFKLSV